MATMSFKTFKVTGESSIEIFVTKNKTCVCQPNSACVKQTN